MVDANPSRSPPPEHIDLLDLEAAINHWRNQTPSPDGISLAPSVRALAPIYATLVFERRRFAACTELPPEALQAWLAWYDTTPDTPCIAICSTSQGDAHCKGCGRTFDEVQHWPGMSPFAKRQTWQRITQEGVAWRFNRYAERVSSQIQHQLR